MFTVAVFCFWNHPPALVSGIAYHPVGVGTCMGGEAFRDAVAPICEKSPTAEHQHLDNELRGEWCVGCMCVI